MKAILKSLLFSVFMLGAASAFAQPASNAIVDDVEVSTLHAADPATITILDVRTEDEVKQGKIDQSVNIDFFDKEFAAKIKNLDASKPVYIYCKSGGRSGKAAKMLYRAGFPEVHNVKGGIVAWEAAGYKTVTE